MPRPCWSARCATSLIREDNGQVIGQWNVPSAVSEVFIYRIPAEEAGREGLQHRILTGSDNRGGFVDTEALRGQRYIYRVRCAVTVDGVMRLSEATEATVEVSAVLAPVPDLSMGAHSPDGSVFELTWTPPPAGRVVIYRSQTAPSAGAETVELPEAALEQIGLGPELRLTQPVSQRHDEQGRPRAVMSGVSWPGSWSRAYFTPVTLLAGRALLGQDPVVGAHRDHPRRRSGRILQQAGADLRLARWCGGGGRASGPQGPRSAKRADRQVV